MVIRPFLTQTPSSTREPSRTRDERFVASSSDAIGTTTVDEAQVQATALMRASAKANARRAAEARAVATQSAAGSVASHMFASVLNAAHTIGQMAMGVPLVGIAMHALTARAPRAAVEAPIAPTTTPTHKVEVVHRTDSKTWAWNELLRDRDPHLVQRNFHPRQVLRDAELIEAFGSDTPHSGDVVLHYAGDPPPGVKKQAAPVILVHGATKNGNYWQTESPLAEHLRSQGFQVYAVSFAHNQDDNFQQMQTLANAIDRVKTLTKSSEVDVVAHSKGGVPARMYASNFREPWMTAYRDDVRRLMLVAAPNGGIDYSFRHPSANFALAVAGNDPRLNAPMSWDGILTPLGMKNTEDVGFGKNGPDYFPGQRQLLAPWDEEYPLSSLEQDYYTSYYGGRGFVSNSKGIDHYAAESGNFMARLEQTRIDPSVQVCIMAGSKPDIAGILNEYTGPSDGLLFLRSAVDLPKDTNVVAETILPLNHKSLLSEKQGLDWITDTLSAPKLKPLTASQRDAIEAPAF